MPAIMKASLSYTICGWTFSGLITHTIVYYFLQNEHKAEQEEQLETKYFARYVLFSLLSNSIFSELLLNMLGIFPAGDFEQIFSPFFVTMCGIDLDRYLELQHSANLTLTVSTSE